MRLGVTTTRGKVQFHWNGGHYTAKPLAWDWTNLFAVEIELEPTQVFDLVDTIKRVTGHAVVYDWWKLYPKDKGKPYIEIYNDYRE